MAITKVSPGLLDLDSGITITTSDNTTQLTLISTDSDANSGPHLALYRNSGSAADGDDLGRIYFYGENDADQKIEMVLMRAKTVDASDGSEDSTLQIYTYVGGAQADRLTLNSTETVLNESSKDVDFRVESDGNANMFTVDAGNNDVLIGNTVAAVASGFDNQAGFSYQSEGVVEIANTNNATTLVLGKNQGTEGNWIDFRKQSTSIGQIGTIGTNDIMMFSNAANHVGLRLGEGYYIPTDNVGSANDNAVDLGLTSIRYKDIYLGGGAYLGGTGSANHLDDYEEGSWTPVIKDGGSTTVTVTVDQATYTKIGRFVMVTAMVTRNDGGSYTGTMHITGLPFAVKAGDTNISGGVWFDGTGTDTVTNCYIPGGSSTAYPKKTGNNSDYGTTNNFQNGRPFYMSAMYHST